MHSRAYSNFFNYPSGNENETKRSENELTTNSSSRIVSHHFNHDSELLKRVEKLQLEKETLREDLKEAESALFNSRKNFERAVKYMNV
jgi:hypothetical protein